MANKELPWVVVAGDFGSLRFVVYGPYESGEEAGRAAMRMTETHDSAHACQVVDPSFGKDPEKWRRW